MPKSSLRCFGSKPVALSMNQNEKFHKENGSEGVDEGCTKF